MIIDLKELLGSSLNSVFNAEQLFEHIDITEDTEIILDFKEIQFVTVSFAQAYIAFKNQSNKSIKETNLSKENEITLKVITQKQGIHDNNTKIKNVE